MSTQGTIAHELRLCRVCKVEKPIEDFPVVNASKWRSRKCRRCTCEYIKAWKRKNPEKNKALIRKEGERIKAARALLMASKGGPAQMDALRRALVEKPPALESEGERLAYFRGLMAGVKRNAEETERFERLKDLPHRIASERASQRGIGYEEAISAAYEGLLVFMRRKASGFASEEVERKVAAVSIRNAIVDYKRSEGPVDRRMNLRYIGGQAPVGEEGESLLPSLAEHEDRDSGSDLWAKIQERLAGRRDKGARLEEILHWRIQGLTQKECGERLGISESRVNQILAAERPWLEEHVLP